jgi:hypothetical protein
VIVRVRVIKLPLAAVIRAHHRETAGFMKVHVQATMLGGGAQGGLISLVHGNSGIDTNRVGATDLPSANVEQRR